MALWTICFIGAKNAKCPLTISLRAGESRKKIGAVPVSSTECSLFEYFKLISILHALVLYFNLKLEFGFLIRIIMSFNT